NLRARSRCDDRNYALAEVRMGRTDHRAFADGGQFLDRRLHLGRIDVEPARDDEILRPPDNVEITALVELAEVPGNEIAVLPEILGGLVRHLPIAFGNIRSPDFDHADAPRRGPAGFRIGNANVHTRKHQAHASGYTVAGIGVRAVHVRFGHAVPFEYRVA